MARMVRSARADQVDVVREHENVFDPNRIVALLAGLAFLLLGALVLVDTGFDGFPDSPLSTVAGLTQTPLLGAIDIVLGLLLLGGAASRDRGLSTFTGGLMLVGGIVIAVRTSDMPSALIANAGYGWLVAIVGAVVLVVALVIPSTVARRRVVQTEQAGPIV